MTSVKDPSGVTIWEPLEENAKGQLKRENRGGRETSFDYDSHGLPKSIKSTGIIDLEYIFDSKGNLQSRKDIHNVNNKMMDSMAYDNLNRLTSWNVYSNGTLVKTNSQTYDLTTGNIASRTDLDNNTMYYGLRGRPHSLDSINGVPANFPLSNLSVTYTDFNKINTLNEGSKLYTLTYGIDDQRRKSVYAVNGVTKQTRYYLGDFEEEIDANGNIRKIHYLSGGAVFISNNGQDSLLFGYADYQGSLIALTDQNGTVLERYAYDPWGQRRDTSNWALSDTRTRWLLNRGYTGHEHLDAFGIINMNGRVYDPLTAQFFSPDPFVQAPGNWLNYNRYGYCYNNPFSYTDPSGEFFWIPILVAAYTAGVFNVWLNAPNIDNGWDALGYFAVGAAAGAVGGIAGQAIGSSIGFIGGALSGGSYGFSAGFLTGAGNAWMGGASFSDGVKTGINAGAIGGLTGGLIGGAFGAITSISHGGNFFTGDGATFYSKVEGANNNTKVKLGEGMEYSNKYARKFSALNFKNVKSVSNLYADGTMPKGCTTKGDLVYSRGERIRGAAVYRGIFKRTTDVYLFRDAFTSKEQLYLTMGHEYIHANLNLKTWNPPSENTQEAIAYRWQTEQASLFNYDNSEYIMQAYKFRNSYTSIYNDDYLIPYRKILPILP